MSNAERALDEPNVIPHLDLWIRYKEHGDASAREQLIVKYLYLVKILSGKLAIGLPPQVGLDDLESYGVLGLIDAVERFEHRRGMKFETYAPLRIRGAMVDGMRQLDWMPASLRRRGKDLDESLRDLGQKLGRSPSEEELAEYLGLDRDELVLLINQTSITVPLSLDGFWPGSGDHEAPQTIGDVVADPDAVDPEASAEWHSVIDSLADALDRLPERERLVISLYYYEGLTLREVADVLDLSAARISQIHSRAVLRLRGYLARRKEMFI